MIHDEFEGKLTGRLRVRGAAGKILVSRDGISSRPESILAEPLAKTPSASWPPTTITATGWMRSAAAKRRSAPPRSATARRRICHLGNIGYRLGRKLKWDPTLEKFAGNDEAQRQTTREPRPKWKV